MNSVQGQAPCSSGSQIHPDVNNSALIDPIIAPKNKVIEEEAKEGSADGEQPSKEGGEAVTTAQSAAFSLSVDEGQPLKAPVVTTAESGGLNLAEEEKELEDPVAPKNASSAAEADEATSVLKKKSVADESNESSVRADDGKEEPGDKVSNVVGVSAVEGENETMEFAFEGGSNVGVENAMLEEIEEERNLVEEVIQEIEEERNLVEEVIHAVFSNNKAKALLHRTPECVPREVKEYTLESVSARHFFCLGLLGWFFLSRKS